MDCAQPRSAFHTYELPPTLEELLAWHEVVAEVVEATEKDWR
jgi:hypothetical protein